MAGVADVRYDRQWLTRVLSAINVVRGVGLVLGSVLVRYAPKRAGQPRRENVSVGTCVCVAMCAAAVPVTTGVNFDAGPPVVLFQATPRQPVSTNDQFVYDVGRDGQQFLIATQLKQTETEPMSIILNWAAKLNK